MSSWASAGLMSLFFCALLYMPVSAEIFTVFSDQGFPPSSASINEIRFGTYVMNDATSEITPPEGALSFKTTNTGGFAGWGFDTGSSTPLDLSRFQSGEFRFWINSTSGNIEVAIKSDGATYIYQKTLIDAGLWDDSMKGKWILIRIPLSGIPVFNLRSVEFPCLFTANTQGTFFYIDNVHYVNSTASPIFNVSVLNNNTNLSDTFSWNPTSASGWVVANQHIQLEMDPNVVSWGVQIYTDNTASDANPKWAGPASTNPAGLVDTTTRTHIIPLAWSIKDSSITAPSMADPNNTSDPNSFQWLFMQDENTPNIPATNTLQFMPGEAYATVKSNVGIHFGGNPMEFGADNPPNNIFLEANLTNALAPLTYTTNKLTVEYFTL
jgi:hypothetical protein